MLNETYLEIFENSTDPVSLVEVTAEGRFIHVKINPAFESLSGITKENLIGSYVDESPFSPYWEFIREKYQLCLDTKTTIDYVSEFALPSGQKFFQSILSPIRNSEGSVYRIVEVSRDITEHIHNEKTQKETERLGHEKLIRQKEQDFRMLSENSLDNIVRYDLEGHIIYLNPRTLEVLGLSEEYLLGKTLTEAIPGNLFKELENILHQVIADGEAAEYYQILPDDEGGSFHYHLLIMPDKDAEGNIIGAFIIGRDVTMQRKLQEALAIRELEFRTLAENSPDIIVRYNKTLHRIYVNPAWEKLNCTRAVDIIGTRVSDKATLVFARGNEYEMQLKSVIKSGENCRIDLQWRDDDGRIRFLDQFIIIERNPKGDIVGLLTISRDVTNSKEIEEILKRNEERLNEAQKIARVGSWEIEFPGLAFYWSDQMYRLLELNPENLNLSYDHFLNLVHPEDRALVDSSFSKSLESKTKYDIDHRMLLPDGRIKYVREQGRTYFDPNGNPLRSIGTVQDITEKKAAEQKIEFMALHDPLTKLPNRVLAKERMEQAIEYADSSELKTALMFIDLDGFKIINDTLGHSVGDAMLKAVASKLKVCIRSTDTLSRLGGDEFIIILSGIAKTEDILMIVRKIFNEFAVPFHALSHLISASLSIGIAIYPEHGDDFVSLLNKADSAMYQAKASGKNCYRFFDAQLSSDPKNEVQLKNDLKNAISNGEFVLHYQPQIDLANNTIIGAEALIRWNHPQQGMVPPMSFIPIAESSGQIVKIGQWVIEEACSQAAAWHSHGMEVTVTVNISPMQFKHGNLEQVVKHALKSSGLNPKYLELELTESIMMHDVETSLQIVQALKALGVQLSIDDFGTGYSSLAYLKRFDVDKLKIDQSFVRDILEDQEDAAIVQTIIQMAKSLNLKCIAEGVENKTVLSMIDGYGCNEVQGYHYAKPMESSSFETYYSEFHSAN